MRMLRATDPALIRQLNYCQDLMPDPYSISNNVGFRPASLNVLLDLCNLRVVPLLASAHPSVNYNALQFSCSRYFVAP
jgi:hypothetical protein